MQKTNASIWGRFSLWISFIVPFAHHDGLKNILLSRPFMVKSLSDSLFFKYSIRYIIFLEETN